MNQQCVIDDAEEVRVRLELLLALQRPVSYTGRRARGAGFHSDTPGTYVVRTLELPTKVVAQLPTKVVDYVTMDPLCCPGPQRVMQCGPAFEYSCVDAVKTDALRDAGLERVSTRKRRYRAPALASPKPTSKVSKLVKTWLKR
jgi:hypothetical protein